MVNPVLVEAWRGTAVESSHRGAVAVVDHSGRVVCALGDVERAVFPRSAVKLLQALPLVATGAADALGLHDDALAVACASHAGEESHTRTVRAMLERAGLPDDALGCGVHWPANEAASRALAAAGALPSAVHNNCSGKHAGFLCLGSVLARRVGAEPSAYVRGYVEREHPVMRAVTAALEDTTGVQLADAHVGTDGCSIPTYAIPLRNLARAFARVATGAGLSAEFAAAAVRLRTAIARSPLLVAGTGRFDTDVMQRLGARVCCKVGAEGVYCAALPELGLGVAIKIDDGNTARAAEVAMAAVIEAMLSLADADAAALRLRSELPLHNWNGITVGQLSATPELRRGLALRAQ